MTPPFPTSTDAVRTPDGGTHPRTLGLSIALCLAVTVGAGLLLDAALHSAPTFLLIGLAVGIVAAVAMAVVTIRKYL